MASSMLIAPPFDPFFSMSRDMSFRVTAAAAPSLCGRQRMAAVELQLTRMRLAEALYAAWMQADLL